MLPSAFPRLKSVSALLVGKWNYNWHEGMYSRSSSMKQMTFLAYIAVNNGQQSRADALWKVLTSSSISLIRALNFSSN